MMKQGDKLISRPAAIRGYAMLEDVSRRIGR